MLRAAHYKPDAVELPQPGKSPPKHRNGGFLDLALTAADKYALSLLPTALKGTALAGSEAQGSPDYRTPQQQPTYGAPTPFKMQRGVGNPLQQTMPAQSLGGALHHPGGDSRMTSSWDASLKEILSALEPDTRTLKPAKLRDHKYPNQNHGMPTNTTAMPSRRELDDALITTLPGGTRRNKPVIPSYTAALKGFSRQSRRPEVPNVDVQYDVVPSVRLAWAGPSGGNYSTTGFGSSPKKYSSQLVGRVSPHYAGMTLQPVSAGSQDPLHLPEIAVSSSFRGAGFGSPSYQSWTATASPAVLSAVAGHSSHPRKALPYVSSHAPSLAKPLAVQYHPVLKSSSMGSGTAPNGQSPGTACTLQTSKSTPQRPSTEQYLPLPAEASAVAAKPLPHGSPSYRLPHTPPEVAAEVSRLRHAQELDGVINGLRSDLQRSGSPRNDIPLKSKFLQMYEDPNRPLTRLNPKQLLGDMMPPSNQQPAHRRQRPPVLATDKRQSTGGGGAPPSSISPNGSSGQVRSPMYERRLKPLPSGSQGDSSRIQREGSEASALPNVHLTPPGGLAAEESQAAAVPPGLSSQMSEPRATNSGRSTPRSLLLEPEDTLLMQRDVGDELATAVNPGPEAADESAQQSCAVPEGEAAPPANASGDQEQEQAGVAEASAAVEDAAQELPPPPQPADAAVDAPGVGDELPGTDAARAGQEAASQPEAAPEQQASTTEGAVAEQELVPQQQAEGANTSVTQPPVESAETAAAAADQEPAAQQPVGTNAEVEAGAAQAPAEPQEPSAPVPSPADALALSAGDQNAESADPEVAPAEAEAAAPSDSAEAATVVAAEAAEPQAVADAPASPDFAGPEPSVADLQELPNASEGAGAEAPATEEAAATAGPAPEPVPEAAYTLPPGVTPEMAEASVVCIQAHARGYAARRRAAELRRRRAAGEMAAMPPGHRALKSAYTIPDYTLPPGITDDQAHEAVLRIQTHARGYFARRRVAKLKLGRAAGEAALTTAVNDMERRKAVTDYQLPPGVTPEMAEASVLRIQAHARGHLARRRVKHLREARAAASAEQEDQAAPVAGDADTAFREAGEAVSTGAGGEDPSQAVARAEAEAEADVLDAAAQDVGPDAVPSAPPQEEQPQELTIDALKAALADDEEDDTAPEAGAEQQDASAAPALDPSDPAAVAAAAAAAAKSARRLFTDEPEADTAAPIDQAAAEASMARLAANSARTSAMFQGAGAEMRYSDDEASALELMDNLDGLLQGDDEAAAAAAAVAAAAAPAEGELVSISADGVGEPQALGSVSGSGAAGASPMDMQEPGGVRVLAGKYEVQHVVGEGAYGMVMKCKVRGTEPVQWVAIKEFKIDDNDPDAEDVKRTSMREVAALEALQHPHVVGFVDKFMVGDRLFIVMEFLPCNLLELLEAQPGGMDRDAVRLIMFQLCSAIAFIHSKGMVYRDIKPENLLVDEHGTVKLCDFGFARFLPSGPSSHLTDYVATRWYRAPELLLGPPYRDAQGKHVQYMYGPQVDMWAVGCLMGELLDGEPLFAGDSDLDQLYRVQQILGPMAPTHQYLFYANPHNTGIVFNIKQPVTLGARYRGKVSDVELSFMMGLLEMDPERRLTGEQCLQHPYLADLAAAANALPTPSASMTPTDLSGGGAVPSDPGAAPLDFEGEAGPIPAPDAPAPEGLSASGEAVAAGGQAVPPARVSPSPMARGPSFRASGEVPVDPREVEKVGSLNRAAGSLTRGGRSLSRGGMSPALGATASPVPGSGSMRVRPNLRTSDSGEVVIVEGVEEGEQGAAEPAGPPAPAQSIGTAVGITAGLSEIEPAD